MKYTTKPAQVDAYRYSQHGVDRLINWFASKGTEVKSINRFNNDVVSIKTSQGDVEVKVGEFIVEHNGAYCVFNHDIFTGFFEPLAESLLHQVLLEDGKIFPVSEERHPEIANERRNLSSTRVPNIGAEVKKALLLFSDALNNEMEVSKISRSKIAEILNVSRPHVTQVLRGKSNMTVEAMVRFALAIDCDIEISLKRRKQVYQWKTNE